MADSTLNYFLGTGTAVEMAAHVPSPPSPANAPPGPGYVFFNTDDATLYAWDGANWVVAVPGAAGGGVAVSAGTQSVSTGTVIFSNSNGITFGMSGSQTVTASHNGLTSQSNQAVSADNGSFTFQTISFSNANGISFNTAAGSAIQASHNGLTSQSNQNITAGNGGFAFQTLSFSNANNFSFGTSAGSAITGSYTTPVVSNAIQAVGSATGSGTNTSRFAADDHVHEGVFSAGVSTAGNTAGDTRVGPGRFVLQGGNNVTLSQITAANALNTIVISGPAAGGVQTGISGIQVSDTTYTSGTVTFQNANGISFGSSGANGISASYTVPSTAGLLSNIRLSAGTTSNLLSAVTFSNLNGISFGLDASTITASVATSLTNIRLSAGTTSNLASAFTFSNANGISFGLDASTITGSHNGLTSQSNQAFSAAGGSSAFQTLGFSDNEVGSFTNTNGSVGLASIRASFFAVSNTTQSSSGTQNLNAISFAGAGIASVGVTNGSILISVPAGGGGGDGGVFAGVSNLGNTAGSTGTVSTGNFVLVGSNGITLSQSTGAAGSAATVTIFPPAARTVSIYPDFPPAMASSSAYSGATTTTAGGSLTSYSLYISPLLVNNAVTFNTAGFLMTHATVAGTGSLTNAQMFGLYTLNAGTALSLVSTFHFEQRISQNSVTARSHYWFWGTNSTSNSSSVAGNISASVARQNLCVLHSSASSLATGNYWLGYMQTMSTGNVAIGSFSIYHFTASVQTLASLYGTTVSVDASRFCGIVSSTVSSAAAHVNIMPASINTSAVTATGGSSQNRFNLLFLGSR